MALSVIADSRASTLEVNVTGTLTSDDYLRLYPTANTLIRICGDINLLFNFSHFDGWQTISQWKGSAIASRPFSHIMRVAIVADDRWSQWVGTFSRAFINANVRCFAPGQLSDARAWMQEPISAVAS